MYVAFSSGNIQRCRISQILWVRDHVTINGKFLRINSLKEDQLLKELDIYLRRDDGKTGSTSICTTLN